MDERELVCAIAAEEGQEVAIEAERALSGVKTNGVSTRGLGLSEAMVIGSFLASCAQLAVEVWRARQDKALLLLALVEGTEHGGCLAPNLDPEKRLSLIGRIVNRLAPENLGTSPSVPMQAPKTKQEWMTDWLGFDTRALTPTILMPFADMDTYIVYEPITWTPPTSSSKDLPEIVTIPRGFVTELATVPVYFWWALPPTGKYGHAAILHDWLYWEQRTSREIADRVFDVAMNEMHVALAVRKTLWAAVRVYGGGYWTDAHSERRKGESRVLKKFPASPSTTWADWRKEPDVFG